MNNKEDSVRRDWGWTAGMILLCLMLTGCSRQETDFLISEDSMQTSAIESVSSAGADIVVTPEPSQAAELFVDVCGAVASPGVYRLEPGSRVFEAVEAAGGLLPEAAGEYVNQAVSLTDGQQIYIPTREETAEAPKPAAGQIQSGAPAASDGKVNINTADEAELMTLNGIGEVRARDIIAYREEHGGFSAIEDIMKVSGIKEGTFNKIKDDIAVG